MLKFRKGNIELLLQGSYADVIRKEFLNINVHSNLYRLSHEGVDALIKKRSAYWGIDNAPLNWINIIDNIDIKHKYNNIQFSNIILNGMGGSSLAPEVIASYYDKKLIVLDSSHPDEVNDVLSGNIQDTLMIVSSKSGSTVETLSLLYAFVDLLKKNNCNISEHVIIITDPGSFLDQYAKFNNIKYIEYGDRLIGGRYSALSAFGIVPSMVLGIDYNTLFNPVHEFLKDFLTEPLQNPAIVLGYILGYSTINNTNNLLLHNLSKMRCLENWIEQLVAESTGKDNTGILPVIANKRQQNCVNVALKDNIGVNDNNYDIVISGDLGSQFILWECAIAIAGKVLNINPFNQPNVQEAKDNVTYLLKQKAYTINDEFQLYNQNNIGLYVYSKELVSKHNSLHEYIKSFVDAIDNNSYLAILLFINRNNFTKYLDGFNNFINRLRDYLIYKDIVVTYGYGPRYLHSTGQYHKGGKQNGSFLYITNEYINEYPIKSDLNISLKKLNISQCYGDIMAIQKRKRHIMRLHMSQMQDITELYFL